MFWLLECFQSKLKPDWKSEMKGRARCEIMHHIHEVLPVVKWVEPPMVGGGEPTSSQGLFGRRWMAKRFAPSTALSVTYK